jgi:uncharacterized protein YyaL (SSP411 family)
MREAIFRREMIRGPVRGSRRFWSRINQGWTSDRAQVLGVAENVMTAMRRVQSAMTSNASAPINPGAWTAKARDTLLPQFDQLDGGLSDRSGTKFPNAPRLALLLSDHQINRTPAALEDVLGTLDAIAFGGIHDHLAGGFHRYSTEPSWSVPHFEKMLYDNAQLLRLYTAAFQITKKPLYRQIAIETARYLGKDMMGSDGGFYTARDAQLDGVEGKGYLWTRGEISSVLGTNEAARFLDAYALTPLPRSSVTDVVHPRDVGGEPPAVLRLRIPIDQTLRDAGFGDVAQLLSEFAVDRAALKAAREKRRQPARDEKIVISLNGLAIAALAESGQILGEPDFVNWAKMAAERIWSLAYDRKAGALKHEIFHGEAQTDGFLQDYAALGLSFTTLSEVTGDKSWRDRATLLADNTLDRFSRPDCSFSTTPHEKDLLIPLADEGDLEMPSGTSMAIDLLLRLHGASGEARYLTAAVKAVRRLSGQFQDHPESWASAITTLNDHPLPSATLKEMANAATGTKTPADLRVPVSADHVSVAASEMSLAEEEAIVVTVKVDDNFHINANPASFDFLIPKSVEFKGVKPSKVQYPAATRFTAKFAPEGLDVYQGSVKLVAKFPKDSLQALGAIQGTVTVQACTNQICLPPSELPVSIGSSGR